MSKASALTEKVEVVQAKATQCLSRALQPGLGPKASVETYTDNAKDYDEFAVASEYIGPAYAAETTAKMFPDPKQRRTVRIFDVASGTGLVAVELQKHGFCNIDALDPSQGMLDVARAKSVYTNMFCDYIGDKQLPIPDDTYDALVMSGGLGENHILSTGLYEMIRLVKPGGFIVNATRVEHLKNCPEYNKLMDDLEEKGKWRQVSKSTFPNYAQGIEGICMVYQVL